VRLTANPTWPIRGARRCGRRSDLSCRIAGCHRIGLDVADDHGAPADDRAVLVHAKDDAAKRFYLRCAEVIEFPENSRTLFLPIETVVGGLG
jgi:hypothetical protein